MESIRDASVASVVGLDHVERAALGVGSGA